MIKNLTLAKDSVGTADTIAEKILEIISDKFTNKITNKQSDFNSWRRPLAGLFLLCCLAIAGVVIETQVFLVQELRSERDEHASVVRKNLEMNEKLAEKYLDKSNEAYQSTLTAIQAKNLEQENSLNRMSEKIDLLLKSKKKGRSK